MTLVEFLRARLDEDEAAARTAVAERQRDNAIDGVPDEPVWEFRAWPDHPGPGILIVGAERALAEVEAKRAIVDDVASGFFDGDLRVAAERLAAVYADHPDYREEWRP